MVPLITFLYLTLSVLITSDNLLVIVAVYSTRALRKVTNYSLVSLALADLLVGCVVLPVRIIEVRAFHWSRNIHWCQFSLSLTLLSLSASVLNLLIVTIERYFAIIHPLTYTSKITSRRNFYAIILVWTVAFVMSFLPFVALKSTAAQERNSQHKVCRFADTMSPEYLTFFSATVVLIPTLFITFAYLKIYRAAKKLRNRLTSLQVRRAGEEDIASVLKESKAAKTIGEFSLEIHLEIYISFENVFEQNMGRFNCLRQRNSPLVVKLVYSKLIMVLSVLEIIKPGGGLYWPFNLQPARLNHLQKII